MRETAAQMLRDVLSLTPAHQGLHRRAELFVRELDADLSLALNPEFSVLFPGDPGVQRDGTLDMSQFDAALERQQEEARHLAATLSSADPEMVAARLAQFDQEAAAVEHSWPRYTPLLAGEIAQRSDRPRAWLQATIDAGCAADVVVPFLTATIQASPVTANWEDFAERCLERPALVGAALYALITHPAPPAPLLRQALKAAGPFDSLVEDCCRRGLVPSETLRSLLTHDDSTIAGAAAVGEWLSAHNPVRSECVQ
jgi:hypothetical protein